MTRRDARWWGADAPPLGSSGRLVADPRLSFRAMHLTILLIVGAFLVFLAARALATPGVVLHDRISSNWAIGVGAIVGAVCALIALTTQMDMVPDDLEAAALPLVLIGVSIALGAGAWYRTFRR